MSEQRTIYCSKEFFSQLTEMLQPEERWSASNNHNEHGLQLWASPKQRLLFVASENKEVKTT